MDDHGFGASRSLLTYSPITERLPFIRRRRLDGRDRELPERNDRRDLADDLDAYAERMADWLDARDVQAPHIIDENTAAILGTKILGTMLRIARDDPERWEAHQQASAHYERVTRTEYIMGWRRDALALFDQAMESGVIAPKIRERFENPDTLQLHALPDVLRKLASASESKPPIGFSANSPSATSQVRCTHDAAAGQPERPLSSELSNVARFAVGRGVGVSLMDRRREPRHRRLRGRPRHRDRRPP